MENYHIAVIDVGKTNKKILIYDHQLRMVDEEFVRIPEIEDGEVLFDDIDRLKEWILKTLTSFSAKYNISVISTSAHGATYALVERYSISDALTWSELFWLPLRRTLPSV